MDLWATLGIEPAAGIGAAAVGLLAAAVLAVRRFQASRRPRWIAIELGGRRGGTR